MRFQSNWVQGLDSLCNLDYDHDDDEKPLGTDNGDGDDLPDQIKITILTNTI